MSFFNFKRKPKHISDGLSLKDLKKQAKKDGASLIVPIEKGKKGVKFYKVGDAVYAPVPNQNEKKPTFFKVANITFVSQEDTNGKAENRYNIAIQYKKHGADRFYSYDVCNEKIKADVCSKLTDAVKIQVRNKEDLLPANNTTLKPVKIQTNQKTLSDEEVEELFFEPLKPRVDETRRKFITNSRKHIDINKKYTNEETMEILKNVETIAKQKNDLVTQKNKDLSQTDVRNAVRREFLLNTPKRGHEERRFFVDEDYDETIFEPIKQEPSQQKQPNHKNVSNRIIVKDAEPSRYDIPKSQYFDRIASLKEPSSKGKSARKLTDEEVEELFFE